MDVIDLTNDKYPALVQPMSWCNKPLHESMLTQIDSTKLQKVNHSFNDNPR